MSAAARWQDRGEVRTLCGEQLFTVDVPAAGPERRPPLLVLHGFPTSSFDFHRVVDGLAAGRRVVLFDFLGYGLSAKPDRAYTCRLQADLAADYVAGLGLDRLGLLTHDVGNTVGGELLARQLEGGWPVEITDRVLVNGSIYLDLAHLSDGQKLLLSLPDARLADGGWVDRDAVRAALAGTFSPAAGELDDELDAAWELLSRNDGQLLLPRLVRYVEERRAGEARFTGAIEAHPSPLGVVWGTDDPIARPAMVDRLADRRPGTAVRCLDRVGHYPMVEAPDRFLRAVDEVTG